MSLSPQLESAMTNPSNPALEIRSPVTRRIPSPAALSTAPPSTLATLLSESYQELESLKREFAVVRKRADKAERLSTSLQALYTSISENTSPSDGTTPTTTTTTATTLNLPESATRILMDFEDRALRAEIARDEAEARKRVLMDTWSQLDSYLVSVSDAAADARAGYARIVSEGGGQLVLAQIPTLSGSKHHRVLPVFPPHPHPHAGATGTRRPRTPSMDGYHQQPPSKKSRGDDRAYAGDSAPYTHPQPYQGEYHYPDPHAPQHTYPPPPPPPHLQRTPHRDHPHPHLAPPHSHSHNPQSQARMILPPHPHHHTRSRSSSSSASLSVDEMLLQASTDENGAAAPPPPTANGMEPQHRGAFTVRRRRDKRSAHPLYEVHPQDRHAHEHHLSASSHHGHAMDTDTHASYVHPGPPTSYRKIGGGEGNGKGYGNGNGNGGGAPAAPGAGGETREFQTHIFAPPVTGAPTKKSKYSVQEIPIPPANPANPAAPFPSVNAEGQRICRQCGVPGRYKEGKCVEKWGPGPMGPGTVCDRCRKKMKRVERRGTMDASTNSVPVLQHPPPAASQTQTQPHRSIHRTDTLHESAVYGSSSTSANYTPPTRGGMRPPPSPQPQPPPSQHNVREDDIPIPTSEIGRGSRSSPRNGYVGAGGSKSGSATPNMSLKRSPLGVGLRSGARGKSREPVAVVVVRDAEDADGEEDDEQGVEVDVGKGVGDARADEEADLLEAVDAAAKGDGEDE